MAFNYYDTGDRTEFAYDGLGRRVKIVEYGPGVAATVQPSGGSYATFTTAPFTLPAGSYSLTFQGLNPNGGDNTAFIDAVTLNGTPVPNGSFESPGVTGVNGYDYNPTDTAWNFQGYSGLSLNNSSFTSSNPNAPAGNQVAFVQIDGVISQTISLTANSYTLAFKAAQRINYQNSFQQLRVILQPLDHPATVKNFVWCGNQICEERDESNNVTKRFFAEGEKRIGGSDAGNYYYSRDHLGSIREVTDSTGALKAQYDYDAWGNSVVVSGNMNVDFGFTGHYFHQPSGMNLTLNRAYNSSLGRWISRDPLKDAEMSQGPNLYWYAANDPVKETDPLGLDLRLEKTAAADGWHLRVSVDTPSGPYNQSFGIIGYSFPYDNPLRAAFFGQPAEGKFGNGIVYVDTDPATGVLETFRTTPQEDTFIEFNLISELGYTAPYHPLTNSCRNYSHERFNSLKQEILNQRFENTLQHIIEWFHSL